MTLNITSNAAATQYIDVQLARVEETTMALREFFRAAPELPEFLGPYLRLHPSGVSIKFSWYKYHDSKILTHKNFFAYYRAPEKCIVRLTKFYKEHSK
jgi:hypothetical protein